jgi:hypothetical protein
MTKKQKQPLFLKGYETNPQGKRVPIYTTVEPVVPYHVIEGASGSEERKESEMNWIKRKTQVRLTEEPYPTTEVECEECEQVWDDTEDPTCHCEETEEEKKDENGN